jgi:glycerol-3-phosphate acyltransferase PlsY
MDNNYLFLFGLIAAYLLGSIPTSVWVGKVFYKIDIRQHGSGNAGGTNTVRILGWKAGIPVIFFDVFKGWAAVIILPDFFPSTNLFSVDYLNLAFGLAAVIGHVYPIYVGFKGGKGVGTLAGVGMALFPWAILAALGIFLVVVFITRYVSLGSIIAAFSFPLFLIFVFQETSIPLISLGVFAALFVLFTHRKNISRLINGEESKFAVKRGIHKNQKTD